MPEWVNNGFVFETSDETYPYVTLVVDTNDKVHCIYDNYENNNVMYLTNESGSWVSTALHVILWQGGHGVATNADRDIIFVTFTVRNNEEDALYAASKSIGGAWPGPTKIHDYNSNALNLECQISVVGDIPHIFTSSTTKIDDIYSHYWHHHYGSWAPGLIWHDGEVETPKYQLSAIQMVVDSSGKLHIMGYEGGIPMCIHYINNVVGWFVDTNIGLDDEELWPNPAFWNLNGLTADANANLSIEDSGQYDYIKC